MQDSMDLLVLFEEHHAPLFRFAYRLTGSVADAEDIVQECFLALLGPARSPVAEAAADRNGQERRPRPACTIPRD